MNYGIELDLAKMNDTKIIEVDEVKGIFIPFESNDIRPTKRGVISNFGMFEKKANMWGQSHFIKVSFRRKMRDALNAKGFEEPIIGHVKSYPKYSRSLNSSNGSKALNNVLGDE